MRTLNEVYSDLGENASDAMRIEAIRTEIHGAGVVTRARGLDLRGYEGLYDALSKRLS